MSKDNAKENLEFEDPEAFEDQVAAEVLEEMGANEPEPEPEAPEEIDDADSEEEVPEPADELSGDEPVADDVSVEDEVSDNDEEDADAFREEFASRHGFDVETIADLGIDQMERLGRNLDKQVLDRLQPQQPAQQDFSQQFQPQPQHLPPNQQQWQQQQPQPQVDLEALRRQAEEEGYDPEFVKALEITHQQNMQLQQQQQWHQDQIERQQFIQNQSVINSFDQNLDNLKVTELFGESKQSATQNPLQFQARASLFNQSLAFSQQTGQPLDSNLISRVAQVIYPEQFNKQQRKSLAQKAMKQHKNKLGSSKSGNAPKRSNPKVNKIADEYGDEVAGILNDPEIRSFISAASPD